MKKLLAILLVVVLSFGVFSACGSKETPAETPAAPAPAEEKKEEEKKEEAAPAETAAKDPKDMKVFYVSKLLGNQYMSVIEAGVRDAVAEMGITDFTMNGTNLDSEIEKQTQNLQDAVSAKPDFIIICPTDSKAMVKPIKEVYDAGIPIVLIDTMIESEDFSAALLTNNYESGKLAAETMINNMKAAGVAEDAEADVAIQLTSTGSQTVMDRVKGFNEYWDANAPEKWKVLNDDLKINDGDITKAVSFTQDFITTYPNLKGLFGPANSATVGFATGLKESGRNDLVLVGYDYSNEVADLIQNTDLNVSTILQKQYMMGYEGIKTGVELVSGNAPAEKIIDTGVQIVNKDNLNDADVQAVVNAGK